MSKLTNYNYNVALIGNPNCGKTTIFNRLTGAQQKVGNWPGVTVEKKTGQYTHQQQNIIYHCTPLFDSQHCRMSRDKGL